MILELDMVAAVEIGDRVLPEVPPNTNVSLPTPAVRMSFPAPPLVMSLPLPTLMMSLPGRR